MKETPVFRYLDTRTAVPVVTRMTACRVQRQRDSTAIYGNRTTGNGNQQVSFARLLSRPTKCLTLLDRHMKEVILRPKRNNMNFFAEASHDRFPLARTRHSYKYAYSGRPPLSSSSLFNHLSALQSCPIPSKLPNTLSLCA